MKPRFNVCAFFKYLIGSIFTFLAPIMLSLLLSAIAGWAQAQDGAFCELFRIHIFDQVLPSVLSLLILVLVSHILFRPKARTNLNTCWTHVLSFVAVICLFAALSLLVVSILYAARVHTSFFLDNYRAFAGVELFSAAMGIIVQCLHNTDVYMVI